MVQDLLVYLKTENVVSRRRETTSVTAIISTQTQAELAQQFGVIQAAISI